MKRVFLSISVVFAALSLVCCGGKSASSTDGTLKGVAEDLWGDAVDLSDYARGITVLHPFSPSDCGYCLFDDEFIYTNYGLNTLERDGAFLGMALFASQLDVYTYRKHYRESYPVLTSPPGLFVYHMDGYPWLCVFKDGVSVFSDSPHPYEEKFKQLRMKFWGEGVPLSPTSNMQTATRFIWENKSRLAVSVLPDGEPMPEKPEAEAWTTKHESDLTDEDVEKNLFVSGGTNKLKLEYLKGDNVPIEISSEKIVLGDYEFPAEQVGLSACFPNPNNPERYVVLRLKGSKVKSGRFENWVDYTVYRDAEDGGAEVLMNGLFEREGRRWLYSKKKAWISDETMSFCRGGKCPSPFDAEPGDAKAPYTAGPPKYERSAPGETWTLGGTNCRFPSVSADPDGGCAVAWEEGGDIVYARIRAGGVAEISAIEEGRWDSFNPVIVAGGADTWVFYLSDQDGFYRLYGSYGSPSGGFNETRISDDGAFDCVTPAACSAGNGRIVVTWSEWKANSRYPKYRDIEGRVLGDTKDLSIKKSDIDYTNGWYASLAAHGDAVWGAWNQHYPITLGVYSGNLVDEAAPISGEMGAYPSLAIDGAGTIWAVWESYMRNVIRGRPHCIFGARKDAGGDKWTLPDNISAAAGTMYNQTPRAAADGRGVIWVVWSGRVDDESPWGIYLCSADGDGWSKPVRVSAENEYARAPSISAGEDGLWLAWHSGRGSAMKVKVLRRDLGES